MTFGRIAGICLAIGVVVAAYSCTGEERSREENFSSPDGTYRIWLERTEKGDIAGSARCLSEKSRKLLDSQLPQMDTFMERLADNVKVFGTYTLADYKIKGERAVVILRRSGEDVIVVPMVKEQGKWKVDLIALFGGGE